MSIARGFVPDPKLKIDGPYLGDLVAAGGVGFLEALHRFNPGRNNRLFAYARHYIEKAVRLEAKRFWNNGLAGETRLDRRIHSRPYDKPEWIAFAIKRPGVRWSPEKAAEVLAEPDTPALIDKIAAAQEAIVARRVRQSYSSTTESGYSDDYDSERSTGTAVKPAGSHDMYRMYDCYNRYRLSPQLRLHEAASRTIDALAVDLDTRAERRLRAMGRRQYALWLVRRQERIAEDRRRFSETNHWLYGNLYRSDTPKEYRAFIASQIYRYPKYKLKPGAKPKSVEKKSKHGKSKRRSRIRVWRSYEPIAAVAA